MVTSIARQSVIIKCNQQTSVLLGNYEFYYLAGLLKKLYQLDLDEDMQPSELYDKIQEHLKELSPANEQEACDKEIMLQFVEKNPDCLERENLIAHFTTSVWTVNKERTKTLMVFRR